MPLVKFYLIIPDLVLAVYNSLTTTPDNIWLDEVYELIKVVGLPMMTIHPQIRRVPALINIYLGFLCRSHLIINYDTSMVNNELSNLTIVQHQSVFLATERHRSRIS